MHFRNEIVVAFLFLIILFAPLELTDGHVGRLQSDLQMDIILFHIPFHIFSLAIGVGYFLPTLASASQNVP